MPLQELVDAAKRQLKSNSLALQQLRTRAGLPVGNTADDGAAAAALDDAVTQWDAALRMQQPPGVPLTLESAHLLADCKAKNASRSLSTGTQ